MLYGTILARDHQVNAVRCLQKLLSYPDGRTLNANVRPLCKDRLLIAAGLAGCWTRATSDPIKTRPSNANSRQTTGHLVNGISLRTGLSQRDSRHASAYYPWPAFAAWANLANLQVCRQKCSEVSIGQVKVKQSDFGNPCLVQCLGRDVAS